MVTKEEILNLANLGKLFVNEDELDDITKEMSNILAFADKINDVLADEDDVLPNTNESFNVLREDVVCESFPQELILKNANGGEDGFFHVKKYSNE